MFIDLYVYMGLAILILGTLMHTFRILREYERGVIFLLGRYWKVKGPGLIIVVPMIQQMVRVDIRTLVIDVPTQDLISRDNVTVKVNAVLYYRVVDPQKAIINVEEYEYATGQLAQTTLRSILGQHDLDEMLTDRDKLNKNIQKILDIATDPWGIKVLNVEIKDIDLDEKMIRAIAKQAEAERVRRAKIINAEGELQASENLFKAAETLSKNTQAMQLRYLNTLHDIGTDKSSTIVFPFPIEMMKDFFGGKK
ncbi:MAG: slipin family protein [Alphaproteobacteria bacterium]|jgi:regulator of protease activity HflC (stomatin/prohibitin superfamily)|nr:slipin family protein [Alphaproteobacteria bacterium]MBT5390384.1 slipin family protein [Alphaproteobacteria bacterium]MBT5540109.1 slipin family protein [Alphaproteobacteria bacterium]